MTLTTVNLVPNWIYLIGFELAIVMLLVSLILFGHSRGLRKLIRALEARVLSLRETIRNKSALFDTLKIELEMLRRNSRHGYAELLEEQLDATRNRHLSLNPDRDIVLDITPDTPIDRQSLALRHAFLISEKESVIAADGKGVDWDILQAKLGQIINFYQQSGMESQDEAELEVSAELDLGTALDISSDGGNESLTTIIENQKRHIANLEKFRSLFFDVERKWREASAEAARYHGELLALGNRLGGGDEFEQLLQSYAEVYGGLGGLLEGGGLDRELDDDTIARPSVGKIVIANQEEIQRLRNMAVDQHKIIVELKRQLSGAESEEEKERALAAMHTQLERNERYLQESDTCIRQLESDLSRLLSENEELKQRVKSTGGEAMAAPEMEQELEMLRGLIANFTEQSRDMLGTIAVLEEDNRRLMTQKSGGDPETMSAKVADLTEKLGQSQQELLNLQTQHIELEERYLELKMQAQ